MRRQNRKQTRLKGQNRRIHTPLRLLYDRETGSLRERQESVLVGRQTLLYHSRRARSYLSFQVGCSRVRSETNKKLTIFKSARAAYLLQMPHVPPRVVYIWVTQRCNQGMERIWAVLISMHIQRWIWNTRRRWTWSHQRESATSKAITILCSLLRRIHEACAAVLADRD